MSSPPKTMAAPSFNPGSLGAGEGFAPTFSSTPETRRPPVVGRRTSATLGDASTNPTTIGPFHSGNDKVPTTEQSGPESPTKQPPPEYQFLNPEIAPSASTVLLEEDAEALDVASYTGPYKQLWNLLASTTDVLSFDVVHDELTRRCNSIITGLMLYEKLEAKDIPKVTEESSHKEKVKAAIMTELGVHENVAMELLCLFLVYEYSGQIKSLSLLFPTDASISGFVKELSNFYYRERLCLLYCAQVILTGASSGESRYSEIFSAFVSAASMRNWAKWLSLSLNSCENPEETAEVLHTLAILLNNFAHFNGVLDAVDEHCHFTKSSPTNEFVSFAEGVLVASLLQCGTQQHDDQITKLLVSHLGELDENPYCYGSIIGFYTTRSNRNEKIGNMIRSISRPKSCVKSMTQLVKMYDSKSFRNRHGLGAIVVKAAYVNAEVILNQFNKEAFGSEDDWFELLDTLLRDRGTAQAFMCEQPDELTALFNDAMTFFPVDNRWLLSYWGALCRIATVDVTAISILNRLAEINYVAEEFEDLNIHPIRPNGSNEWISMEERSVYGIRVKSGSLGTTVREASATSPIIISWSLDAPCRDVTVWEILLGEVLKPFYYQLPVISDKLIKQVGAIGEFLLEFSETTTVFPDRLFNLVQPTADIIKVLARTTRDQDKKSRFVVQLLKVVKSGAQFDMSFFLSNSSGLWPLPQEQNLVCELILAHESVLNSNYSVTKTFLLHMADLFQKDPNDPFNLITSIHHNSYQMDQMDIAAPNETVHLRPLYINAVRFILENIFPSFVRWRMKRSEDQFQIIRDTFRVFDNLFQFKQKEWDPLKSFCCESLLTAGSSLLAVLKTDEETLQDSWIRTNPNNVYQGETVYYALSLIVQLANFDVKTLRMLDNASNLTLVQKLGRLVRHRIDPNIPTLALGLLKRIAQELNISVLACFGNGIDSFRDLLLQRLEYKTEHLQLKVVILDFLTVCAQAQPGLIQHFFHDSPLTSCLFSFLKERDQRLPVASLRLMRALFRKGNTILKKHPGDIWQLIADPLKNVSNFNTRTFQKNIITYTMNIFCFELHCNGVSEKDFDALLREILSGNLFQAIIVLGSEENNVETEKCLLSIKHFLILLLSRPDFEDVLAEETRSACLNKVTFEFWKYMGKEAGLLLLGPLAELMYLLSPTTSGDMLESLTGELVSCFAEAKLPVQVPLLALINKSIEHLKGDISLVTIENIVRVVATVFAGATRLYDAQSTEMSKALLSVASSTIYTIISWTKCEDWLPIFKRRCLINSIVWVTNFGLKRGVGPEIVQECLFALIRLCDQVETSDVLRVSNLSQLLWTPSIVYAASDGFDEKWADVYLLCCQLNTAMIKSQKFYYLEEALNFYGIHGEFMIMKLFALTDLIHHCYLQSPEQNYQNIKQLMTFNYTILYAISEMVPYFQQWRISQFEILERILKGVFTTLETSVSLLSQPNHLLQVISKNIKPLTMTFKLTPQLLEIQTKLWEVLSMGIHIYWRMKRDERQLVSSEVLVQLLISIVGLCGRGLSKHGDKKSHPMINVTSEVSMTLEKSLALLYDHILLVLAYPSILEQKEIQTFRREITTEIMTICDTLRRASLPREDFSLELCSSLEALAKRVH